MKFQRRQVLFRLRAAGLLLAAAVLLAAPPADAVRPENRLAAAGPEHLAGAPGAAAMAPRVPTPIQQAAAAAALAGGVEVKWHPRLGTPRQVRGADLGRAGAPFQGAAALPAGATAEQRALAVLNNLAGLFALRDAAAEFTLRAERGDELGFRHVRLTQRHAGLRVIGGELIVHCNAQGAAYEVNGQYVAGLELPVRPGLTPEQAADIARADQAARGLPAGALPRAPELVVFALDGAPVLAYELALHSPASGGLPGRWRYWIDAASGAVRWAFNDVKTAEPPTTGTHVTITGSLLTGEGGLATNLVGWLNTPNSLYYLYNTNVQWIIYNAASNGWLDNTNAAYRATSDWGTNDPVEISAANNFQKTQEYFRNVHGRRSFDDANYLARANVHYGALYNNAFWDSSTMDFTFGDGDGESYNALTVLDVAAHEFTHAVTEYSAELSYNYTESGALNESFSDIFGACVEFRSQPDGRSSYPVSLPGRADWLMGEDAMAATNRALRDLRNPAGSQLDQGSSPTRYRGTHWDAANEMHINSTVQSFMFYLLSEGGSGNNDGLVYSVTGLGLANAEQIAYRTLTVYLTPYACYADARDAWVSAARDLNPAWAASVIQAWAAVGFSDAYNSDLGEAVNASDRDWYTGGNTAWVTDITVNHDGVGSARSGAITNDQMSKMETTVSGVENVAFWWRVSSETNWDFLTFYIDGIAQTGIAGSVGWQYRSFPLTDETHVLKWAYQKDQYLAQGQDAGWLDEVTLLVPLVVSASQGAYGNRVAVTWNPKRTSTQYEIWRARNSSSTSQATLLALTTATSYNDTTAVPLVLYYYWIRARTPSGTTPFQHSASGWRAWVDPESTNPPVLRATDFQLTPSALPMGGYPDTVETRIVNTSLAATSAWMTLTLYLSPSGAFSTSHPSLGSARRFVSLAGEQSVLLQLTDAELASLRVPGGARPGDYTVYLKAHTTKPWLTNNVIARTGALRIVPSPLANTDDFDGDGQSDLALYSESDGAWLIRASATRANSTFNFGGPGWRPARGDFDGDGRADPALFHAASGTWIVRRSQNMYHEAQLDGCGASGDLPVSGDFDGDGLADPAVYHPDTGRWLVRQSGRSYAAIEAVLGTPGGLPVAGDFDGDGLADPAVYWPDSGLFTAWPSAGGYQPVSVGGLAGCVPVAADFDNDLLSDPATYLAGLRLWQTLRSASGYAPASVLLGDAGWRAVSGDFDGDGRTDLAVYLPATGVWQFRLSAYGYAISSLTFGGPDYLPLAASD